MKTYPKPEIMSPAGYWPQMQAAIEAGADAIYFGLKHFTARAKVGFELAELPDVMRTLHQRGVKGYVTFNTLVFDRELNQAAESLAAIAEAGADSIIVQDVGIAQLAQRVVPDLAVHGSTQMSITSAEGVAFAQQFGVSRVVLARELALAEIRAIRSQLSQMQSPCELEMFVHGALCVSYSGQCFSSEAWGGRSANRGQCAQACRLPYELLVDEVVKPLGDARYLLSPGDLYALQQMPEIVQLGVSALKIEGRYKDAEYVALTTQAYRKAVDEAWAGLPLSITRHQELQLEQVYSRGLGPWFITGTNHQTAVNGRSPRHRGVLMGRVLRVQGEQVLIAAEPASAESPLKPGDGVVFDAADWRSPEQPEEGGRVYQVLPRAKGQIEVHFGNGAIHFARIRPGDRLWRSHDPELDKVARPFTQAETPVHKQPVNLRVVAQAGAPLLLEWTLVKQPSVYVTVQSDQTLGTAQNQTLTPEFLRQQLGRLGNTAYELHEVEVSQQGNPFVPSSLLNQLRRQAVEQLQVLQAAKKQSTINSQQPTIGAVQHSPLATARLSSPNARHPPPATLHLLVRTAEQLDAAIDLRPASITLDYLDLYGLRPAVERVQEAGITVRVASPRVLKPNEQRIVHFLRRLDCAILVRSSGLLYALQTPPHSTPPLPSTSSGNGGVEWGGVPLIGDFSLNVANQLSAQLFLQLGLTRITPTHDLNAAQVTELAQSLGAERLEVVAYQHLPVFHTEHCVFCRFLSTGTSYKDCGHPCEKHRVALRDVNGRAHPVMADVGCRNTVFGAEAQEASQHLAAWQAVGIQHFRLEFVHESAKQVTQITRAFEETLRGRKSYSELHQQLKRFAPQNTTEGSLFVPIALQV